MTSLGGLLKPQLSERASEGPSLCRFERTQLYIPPNPGDESQALVPGKLSATELLSQPRCPHLMFQMTDAGDSER